MGKISTYTVLSTPTLNDKLIGSELGELKIEDKYTGKLHIRHVNDIHFINKCSDKCNH